VAFYAVAPSQLYDGMTHLVQFNAINGAAPTLNVNTLGAKPLHFWASGGWGAWPANMVAIDQVVRITYNAAAGTYRALDMQTVLNQSVSGATVIDFTGIPANVNTLRCAFNFTFSATAAPELRTYGADGVLDVGSTDYGYVLGALFSNNVSVPSGSAGAATIFLTNNLSSGNPGLGGNLTAANIQAASFTNFEFSSFGVDAGGSLFGNYSGGGARQEADRITGLRVLTSAGTFTGTMSVAMS
jgi:hypothetical protein